MKDNKLTNFLNKYKGLLFIVISLMLITIIFLLIKISNEIVWIDVAYDISLTTTITFSIVFSITINVSIENTYNVEIQTLKQKIEKQILVEGDYIEKAISSDKTPHQIVLERSMEATITFVQTVNEIVDLSNNINQKLDLSNLLGYPEIQHKPERKKSIEFMMKNVDIIEQKRQVLSNLFSVIRNEELKPALKKIIDQADKIINCIYKFEDKKSGINFDNNYEKLYDEYKNENNSLIIEYNFIQESMKTIPPKI